MKRISHHQPRCVLALCAATLLAGLAPAQANPPPGTWTLSLDEEFNGTALNTAIWNKGMRWNAIINNELEGYVPENVTVANGVCTLKVEKRTVNNKDMYGNTGAQQSYASGCLQTYKKWTQAYGYFEASIKMSSGTGTWPAFWLLPDRGNSVTNESDRVAVGNTGFGLGNEIDIVEYLAAWKDPGPASRNRIPVTFGDTAAANRGAITARRTAASDRQIPMPRRIRSFILTASTGGRACSSIISTEM